ncbi:zinc finger CCCH domain-containing protein 17-like [Panicum miliaceum]|uniref:Zinc finger CCCH domain-containing protein 17-like n=1 Tax=Panicum miliaceum TaxID=4540 RepID=A0A3L6R1M9_PANMI|nr:zinc finger CCCH domain-containing protein 17-like [Panicum miliaceum]
MPISSTLAGRLGTGPARAPAPARWSPYARSSVPEPQGGRGGAKASRPPLRLDPATERLLGPAQKAAPSGSRRRAEPAAPDAASAAPAGRSRGGEMTSPEPVLKPKPKPDAGDDTPPVEKPRCSGGGGFVFLCALAGHTAAISGISVPRCSDKLYSGSVDGSIRVWDRNSGKCIDVIKLGGKAWNTQTGMKLSLEGPSGLVCSMTITDGMLFAGTGDGRIMAWKFPSKESNMEPVSILTGHQRPVISLSISATRLYSGSLDKTIKLLSCSLDKTVKLWTLSESGDLQVKYTHAEEHGLRTLFGMHRVGKTPVLFCSLHNSNCIASSTFHRKFIRNLFEEVGTLSSKKEVRTIELADGGPLFTGDCSGELKVWRWAPQQDQDQEAASAAHS